MCGKGIGGVRVLSGDTKGWRGRGDLLENLPSNGTQRSLIFTGTHDGVRQNRDAPVPEPTASVQQKRGTIETSKGKGSLHEPHLPHKT